MMNSQFWKNKRVFVTGHTGFKGGWMVMWLREMGACVKGFSLPPRGKVSLYHVANISEGIESSIGDVRDLQVLSRAVEEFDPEIIIHMAAQPLVRASYMDPVETYQTNVMGTVNLFESVRASKSVRAVVNVTTDKCYLNKEWVWGYREQEQLGGYDPYSNSKACSELVTSAYRQSFFQDESTVSLASARAGNVIGGGDWSKDRLIPDVLQAFGAKTPVVIRNPLAIRPWQHVLEPISGYLRLAEKLYDSENEYADAWNFGPNEEDARPVSEILDYFVDHWPHEASWVLDETSQPHEAQLLKLDISKAKAKLYWTPRWDLETAIQKTIEWHLAWVEGKDMKAFSLGQISEFQRMGN